MGATHALRKCIWGDPQRGCGLRLVPPPRRLRLFVVETLSYEFSSRAVDGSGRGIVLTGR